MAGMYEGRRRFTEPSFHVMPLSRDTYTVRIGSPLKSEPPMAMRASVRLVCQLRVSVVAIL